MDDQSTMIVPVPARDRQMRIDLFEGITRKAYLSPSFLDWLIASGYFDAPASSRFHGACEGGLFEHSWSVMGQLQKITQDNGIQWRQDRSPVVVGLLHDVCKVDQYVKTDVGYARNPHVMLLGHGDKSVTLIQQHVDLTSEELLCIRWHMGAFDDQSNWSSYTEAIHRYQTVLWTHVADMIAAHVMGI